MLSTGPSNSLETRSPSVSSNPRLHPDSVALLKTRVPESLHSVLVQYVFSDSQKTEQSRRFRSLLKLEASGNLIPFLERQSYAPEEIYDLYAAAPSPKRAVTQRRKSVELVHTSVEPLPADAQRRIREAMAALPNAHAPKPTYTPARHRPADMFSDSIPESLDAPALASWLRRHG